MTLPRNKVALNVAVSREARKLLAVLALEKEKTMAELVEEMIRMKYQEYQEEFKQQKNGIITSIHPAVANNGSF